MLKSSALRSIDEPFPFSDDRLYSAHKPRRCARAGDSGKSPRISAGNAAESGLVHFLSGNSSSKMQTLLDTGISSSHYAN